MDSAHWTVLITLIAYKLALIAIGIWANKKTKHADDFFLGGRQLGPWVAAISASASSSSAWTLMGVSGAAYAWGLSAIWLLPACIGGFALNWFIIAPRLQKFSSDHQTLTLTETLFFGTERQIQRKLLLSASAIVLFSLVFYVASQFQGSGKTFVSTFGFPLTGSVVVGGLIVLLYTVIGGFWAVSVTDTLQGLLMAATAILIPGALIIQLGWPHTWIDPLSHIEGYSDLLRYGWSSAGVGFVVGLLGIGLGYPGQPHVVNRFMAVGHEADLKKARRIAMSWAFILYPGMLITGWGGRMLFHLGDSETVFIEVANTLFHPVIAGILIAAVLSAIMSTADSQLLVAASALTTDLEPLREEKKPIDVLWRSRMVVVLLCVVAILLALTGSKRIFDKVLFAWSAMGAAFGPLLMVRLWKGTIKGSYMLAAMWVGFISSVVAYNLLSGSWKAHYGGVLERCMPIVLALGIAWLGARAARK
ncbi:MAG: sodium/proline symporter [Acidobacteria bacterium]|nr:sodium/proline symporter [Acidobacteriota bacterium]